MPYRTMLDTNIVSDLIRNPHGKAAHRLARHGSDGICISIVTSAELRYGAAKRASTRLWNQVEVVLASLDILPFETPADFRYGEIRAILTAAGTPIGLNDLWIAAHALALGATLITHNLAEFRRVPGLAVETWLD